MQSDETTKNQFKQPEILAYLEEKRRNGKNRFPDFLPELKEDLKKQVEGILLDKEEIGRLSQMLDGLIAKNMFLHMTIGGDFPGRYLAEYLEEIIGEKGIDLLFETPNPLGFSVHLDREEEVLKKGPGLQEKKTFTLSILGLGDVGGTLLIGLRLLGKDILREIRIFDLNLSKRRRYYLECNEISDGTDLPEVTEADLSNVFDTDCLVFTISIFVPPVGTAIEDVRMVQFEKNRKVLLDYARMAEEAGFKGYYFIVSDPVDLLCMSLMEEGNIASHRIRGFGLGVMEARARFIAKENKVYAEDLRAFGPHGKGLVVINSLKGYDAALSKELTSLAEKENFRVRETGYKPYIAPALSSGSISILKALDGKEHLSTWFNGNVFMGSRNTLKDGYTKPSKVSLLEIKPLLVDTERLLVSLYTKGN